MTPNFSTSTTRLTTRTLSETQRGDASSPMSATRENLSTKAIEYPNNIEQLKQKYPLHVFNNQLDFLRDALIVALIAAKDNVSNSSLFSSSPEDKKQKIDDSIKELKNLSVEGLNKTYFEELYNQHLSYLNEARSKFFSSNAKTNSGQAYEKIINEANNYLNELNSELNKKYTFDSISCSISDLRNDHLEEDDEGYYKIFKSVFINPPNQENLAMRKAMVNFFENKEFYNAEYVYKIFAHVFIKQTGIFANSADPLTIKMRDIMLNKICKMGNYSEAQEIKFKIFEHVFIEQRGVFANSTDPSTIKMHDIVCGWVKDLGQDHIISIFNSVFIANRVVFASNNYLLMENICKSITDSLMNQDNITHYYRIGSQLQSPFHFRQFRSYIDNIQLITNRDDPRTHAMSLMIIKLLESKCALESNFISRIFDQIFISPSGIFADSSNDIQIATTKAIKVVEYHHIENHHIEKIWDSCLNPPAGILADANNPSTIELRKWITTRLKEGHISDSYIVTMFENAFIHQNGILGDHENASVNDMRDAIIHDLKTRQFNGDVYNSITLRQQIFDSVFITPTSILADENNEYTIAIRNAIVKSMDNLQPFGSSIDYTLMIFKYVFIEQQGVFATPDNKWTAEVGKAIVIALKDFLNNSWVTEQIINSYKDLNDNHRLQLLDILMIKLLANGQLYEPEVIDKIVTRLANNLIDIPLTEQGIDFFVRLSTTNNLALLNLLAKNLNYFISKDGVAAINKILATQLLIKPLAKDSIKIFVENQLISKLQQIKKDVDVNFINGSIIKDLRKGKIRRNVDNTIKTQIKNLINESSDEQIKNLNDQQIVLLVNEIHNANGKLGQIKMSLIHQAIRRVIFNDLSLTEPQIKNVAEFAKSLATIDIDKIQRKYVKKFFLDPLEIKEKDQRQQAYNVISGYFKWDRAIDKCRQEKLQEISEQIINNDEEFKKFSELYYNYILNTLLYRSYANILSIINSNDNIPSLYEEKLQLVIAYCQLSNCDPDDKSTLNLLVVEDNQIQKNCLITLQNLDYLSNTNIKEFKLELLGVNYFTNNHYNVLKKILINNSSSSSNDEIDCLKLDIALFNNIAQLKNNNILSEELAKILENFIQNKKITKANLETIVNSPIIKMFLKEVEAQSLGFNHLKRIIFPPYLRGLIINRFTAHNIVASHISRLLDKIIVDNNIIITNEQNKKLEEICYQVALNPCKDVSIDLAFKKKLIDDFSDLALLVTAEVSEKTTVPAGDFIQIKEQLMNEFMKLGDNEKGQLEKLPELLIETAKQLAFTAGISELIENLFKELDDIPELTGKIIKHEIYYLMGVIFMCMSSSYVLGINTTAFTRFRLLASYCLSESVFDNDMWTQERKEAISKEIKQAILTGECSGQITNRLYGEWCLAILKDVYEKVTFILHARVGLE